MCRKFVFICLICLFSLVYLQQAGADYYKLYVTVVEQISNMPLQGVTLHLYDAHGDVGHDVTKLFGKAEFSNIPNAENWIYCDIDYYGFPAGPNRTHAHKDWNFIAGGYHRPGSRPPSGYALLYLIPLNKFNTTIRVVDAIGTQAQPLPLSGVEVRVYNQGDPNNIPPVPSELVAQGSTDANGYFNLPPLPAALYSCTLTKVGFQPAGGSVFVERNTVPTGDCNSDICFAMNILVTPPDPEPVQQCCLNTTITVRDQELTCSVTPPIICTHIPIPGAAVQVYDSGWHEQLPPGKTTDGEGKIILPMLNIERYYYTISRASFATKTGWFDNIAGENPVNVYMQRN